LIRKKKSEDWQKSMPPQLNAFHPVEMTDADFDKISRLVHEICGINLTGGKKELLKARLGRVIRKGAFPSFRDYYEHVVQDPSGEERARLLDAVSTNFTGFFREPQHFEYLKARFLPEMAGRTERHPRKLRFWSAGCSSGEEAYSLAMALMENLDPAEAWDLRIIATDLSREILKIAAAGIYPQERIRSLPFPLWRKYFLRGEKNWAGYVRVKDSLKKYISFERLNLMEAFSFAEPLDCIFCRNVMIYFDKPTQVALLERFYHHLTPGGVILIGHSESLAGIQHPFRYVKPAIFRKEK
jgi:chemotaxis protein methyltransferase CheR